MSYFILSKSEEQGTSTNSSSYLNSIKNVNYQSKNYSSNEVVGKSYVVESYIPELGNLKKSLVIEVNYEGDSCLMSVPDLDIYEMGSSLEDAKINLYNFFSEDSKNYINTPDSELSEDGNKLKSKYQEYI